MERKENNISSLLGSTTTMHIIGEVVAIGGVLYYVNNQISQLNAKIMSLEQKVSDLLKNVSHVPGKTLLESKESFLPPHSENGKWVFLKPVTSENNCIGDVCLLPKQKGIDKRNGPDKNVSFNGSVEQLKYGNSVNQKSTRMMIGSPSMRPFVPESVDENDEETEKDSEKNNAGFSGIRKIANPDVSETEINKLVSKAIRPVLKKN
jgi:hypothetical protein